MQKSIQNKGGTNGIVLEKNLEPLKREITTISIAVNQYRIANENDLAKGADLLHEVKNVKSALTKRKEEITRPIMQSLESVRDLFRPLEDAYKDAERIIKEKMTAFQLAETKRIKAKQDEIKTKLEQGKIKTETAISRLENVGEVSTKFEGIVGKISFKTHLKLEITDEKLIPRAYLVPDRVKITGALRAGLTVAGAKLVEEKIPVAR